MRFLGLILVALCLFSVMGIVFAEQTVKLTITYNGTNIDGKLYYFDGSKTVEVTISNGTAEFTVPSLPTNVTVVYNSKYFIFNIKGNGTVELTAMPYEGNITVKGVDVSGIVLENTKLTIPTIKKDTTFTFWFNTTTVFTIPDRVFGFPAGIYNLKTVNVTGSVTFDEKTYRLTYTGSGSAVLEYVPFTIAGIPVIYIALAVFVIAFLGFVFAKRGGGVLSKSTGKKYFKLST